MPAQIPVNTTQDEESVRNFFDQWHIYRKAIDHNLLFHREAFDAIGKVLAEIPTPFSFIDLGAGDAEWTSRVHATTKVKSYEAVDLSSIALGYAEKNLAKLSCPKKFTQANFYDFVKQGGQSYDIAFIGLSFHHLKRDEKGPFLSEMRRIINKGGRFLFYEPILEPQDTCREDMLNRWWKLSVLKDWGVMTEEELQKIHDHVFGHDYPETNDTFCDLALKAGFSEARVLTSTPGNFYAVFDCIAG